MKFFLSFPKAVQFMLCCGQISSDIHKNPFVFIKISRIINNVIELHCFLVLSKSGPVSCRVWKAKGAKNWSHRRPWIITASEKYWWVFCSQSPPICNHKFDGKTRVSGGISQNFKIFHIAQCRIWPEIQVNKHKKLKLNVKKVNLV